VLWLRRYERKKDRKLAIMLQCGQFDPTFQVEGVTPTITFARLVRSMNAIQVCRWQFLHKETWKQTFFKRSAILEEKWPFAFLSPPPLGGGGLGATYDDHLRLIGQHIGDFLLVLIELFFARSYGWGSTSEYLFKCGDFAPMGGRLTQNFR